MDDLLQEFLVESNENLNQLDQEIVELEANPNDLKILKSIFRTIHTVKGSCGFLGLSRMEKVAHVAEDVLGKMRDGVLEVCPENIGPVLCAVDTIRLILSGLEETESEPQGDDSEVIANLQAILDGHSQDSSGDDSSSGETESAMVAAVGEEIAARLEREHSGEPGPPQFQQEPAQGTGDDPSEADETVAEEEPKLNDTVVIMCTSNNSLDKIQEALHAGANEYVMKPFTDDIIREKLVQTNLAES